MVRQEQLRNSLFVLFLFFISCGEEMPSTVDLSNENLSKNKGVYYWEDEPYSGKIVTCSEGGDTLEICEYLQGKRNGVGQSWWPGGVMRSSSQYKNDVYEGEVLQWYPSGQLYKQNNYVNGKEVGLQKMWNEDGSVRANYEVIGDRKYGLTGVKNCTNSWDEE